MVRASLVNRPFGGCVESVVTVRTQRFGFRRLRSAIGRRLSSAQLTTHYMPEDLRGRLVVAVTNFPARQVGPVRSEVLVLGVPDEAGAIVLLHPDLDVPLGARVF